MPNRKRTLHAFLIILAIVIGIEIIGLYYSPSPPPQKYNQEKTYQEKDSTGTAIFFPILRNTVRGINCVLDWIGTNSAAIVALATIAIALFTWTLWRATTGLLEIANRQAKDNLRAIKASERAAEVAEKAMVSSQRAFVFVKRFDVIKDNGPHKLSIIPEWYNNGSTQANYLLTCVNGKYFPFLEYPEGIPDDYTFPDLGEREDWPMDHPPKSVIYGSPLNFSEEIVNDVIAGLGCIYVWGWVEYNDIFDNTYRHRTEFCDEVVIKSLDIQEGGIGGFGASGIGIRTHKKHNGADDYCFKKPMTKYIPPT
jgi:hypothetical protein